MTIASEFIQMAQEMLGDPEIGCDGVIKHRLAIANPSKPWEPDYTDTSFPVRLFYTTAKGGMVNGSVVLKGEKVFIAYDPVGLSLADTMTDTFIDHTGGVYKVNAIESISAGNTNIVYYVKVGA